ncbi:MAG: hypothetical protein ACPGYV_02445 [Phycisphaeraceae bacterium]
MQRPTRILIFGILCLVVGGGSGLKSLFEAGVALAGPERLSSMVEMVEAQGQSLSASQRRDLETQIEAMRSPVYRGGLGVKTLASLGMAGVLVVAGFGLLRDQAWSLRLARVWAWYAIGSAGFVAVLQSVYLVPAMQQHAPAVGGMAGAAYFGIAVSLVLLCVFPVLLLRLLPAPAVVDYLNNPASRGTRSPAAATPAYTYRPPTPTHAQTPPTPATRPMLDASSQVSPRAADTTWRDDPWNDPSSQ